MLYHLPIFSKISYLSASAKAIAMAIDYCTRQSGSQVSNGYAKGGKLRKGHGRRESTEVPVLLVR